MAIISIKDKDNYIAMSDINAAAGAVLYGKGLMLSIDFSDGKKPVIGHYSPLMTYIPNRIADGRFTFDTVFGWMYSMYKKGDDGEWVNTYSGSFRMGVLNRLTDDPDGLKKYRMLLWPVNAMGLPLCGIL